MIKSVAALVATLIVGWVVTGSATSASARECHRCGPLPTTVHVHVIHPSTSYTRYHDRSVYRHVPRYHEILNITKVQPIIHIHDVTRVHHRTIFYVKDTYAHETIHERPVTYVSSSVRNYYEGGCGCAP